MFIHIIKAKYYGEYKVWVTFPDTLPKKGEDRKHTMKKNVKKKILSGISFSGLRFVIGFVVAIIQTPILFKYLEKEELGAWYLFFSLAAFIQMSDFGLPAAVSRAVAYIKNGSNDSEQSEVKFFTNFSINDIYKSSFNSFILLSAFVVIIGSLLIYFIKPDFGVAQNLSNSVNIALSIFLLGVFFNMTANIPNACLSGLGDVGYDNLIRIIVQIVGLILIFIILPLYSSIIVMAVIYLFQGIISTAIVHIFLKIRHNDIFKMPGAFNYTLIKKLYSESSYLFINQLGGWLTNQSGIWIATYILGAGAVADYSVTVQLIFYGLSLSMSIPIAINPYATAEFSSNGVRSVQKYFFIALKMSTFVVGFWIILLSVWGESIFNLWIGKGHYLGYSILIPLLFNVLLEMQHSINGGFVWNTGKWPFVPATISAGILNVIFCFVGCYYWDLIGLAFGTMFAKLFTLNWYVVFYALKRLKISIKRYALEYFSPSILLILIVIIISYFIHTQIIKLNFDFSFRGQQGIVIVALLLGVFYSFILFGVLFYNIVADNNEKKMFLDLIKKIIRK